jgi:hypothetical protein
MPEPELNEISMSKDDRRGESAPPASLPPESAVLEAQWDDDAIEFLTNESEQPDPFDRVTAIPGVPPEEYVLELMAEADRAERGLTGNTPNGSAHKAVSADALSSPRVPVFEVAAITAPPQAELDPLSLDLDDAEFDGPHVELTIERPETKRSAPKPVPPKLPEAKRPDSHASLRAESQQMLVTPLVNLRGVDALAAEMKDRYAMGDFSGALLVADSILEQYCTHAEAEKVATNCRATLTQMYSARLGALNQLVTVCIPSDQIRWLSLDHRAGFLLSLIDGLSSIEEILDVSGMPRLDALRIMCTLLEQRVISLSQAWAR